MPLATNILRPLAFFSAWGAGRQTRSFLNAHRRTREVQDALLRKLIASGAQTGFGIDHSFSSIRGYEDFKAAVPVGNYDTLRPYMQRVFEGEVDALFGPAEEILMFSKTSGTTGSPKYIPVTRRFLEVMRRGWNIFGLQTLRDHPEGWLRPILQITSPMQEHLSPTGIPCGAISGLLAGTQMRVVRRMYVVPPGVSGISDPIARYYTTLRCGIARRVTIITTANPSSTLKLIETGGKHIERLLRDVADGTVTPPGEIGRDLRASLRFKPNPKLARRMENGVRTDGKLLPRHFWNVALLTNWTGGTLKLYLPRLKELFGDVPIRDIGLLASEGRFSLPMEDNTPAGIAEITGNFLEFIPADAPEQENPPTLRIEQLEVGQEYFLVVTNWAGLWRYNMDDRVRVTDRFGTSVLFEFLSRGVHTANITGEKITEYQVVEAMRMAGDDQSPIERFVMQGCFAQTPYYELRLEGHDGTDLDVLGQRVDRMLCELNVEYRSKRESGRLDPIRVKRLPEGSLIDAEFNQLRDHAPHAEQYKHQYLLTEVLEEHQTSPK